MLILAIDTALEACAAAVLDTETGQLIAQESQAMKRGHAEALMPLIGRVIAASGIAFASLGRIAVTTGPGSFTGLRVGLSAARGIALAANIPVVGVTTLAAYAAPVVSQNAEHPVISVIDARHDHVYLQVVSGNGSALVRPRVAPMAEAINASRFGAPCVVGNAAALLAERWPTDAAPPVKVDMQSGARYRLGRMVGSCGQPEYGAGPSVLSSSPRCQAAQGAARRRRADPFPMMTWLSGLWGDERAVVEPASERDVSGIRPNPPRSRSIAAGVRMSSNTCCTNETHWFIA